ncbi:hypothetical protein [Micromonospora sp. NPDC093277]|uniref:hypothetical protein n=1 Tax=Micromonospora sp. NPDC093277 TaxID=3364291 RepID=UPI00380447AE
MSLRELRLALYLLAMLITNGLAIPLLVHVGGWPVAFLPVAGTVFAIQYGRTLPRSGGTDLT